MSHAKRYKEMWTALCAQYKGGKLCSSVLLEMGAMMDGLDPSLKAAKAALYLTVSSDWATDVLLYNKKALTPAELLLRAAQRDLVCPELGASADAIRILSENGQLDRIG